MIRNVEVINLKQLKKKWSSSVNPKVANYQRQADKYWPKQEKVKSTYKT